MERIFCAASDIGVDLKFPHLSLTIRMHQQATHKMAWQSNTVKAITLPAAAALKLR